MVLAVAHDQFKELGVEKIRALGSGGPCCSTSRACCRRARLTLGSRPQALSGQKITSRITATAMQAATTAAVRTASEIRLSR